MNSFLIQEQKDSLCKMIAQAVTKDGLSFSQTARSDPVRRACICYVIFSKVIKKFEISSYGCTVRLW